jgi:hypothetical protein
MPVVAMRRLPVLQNASAEDEALSRRPRWHWAAIGTGFVFTMWLPLVMLALWLGARLATLLSPRAGSLGAAALALVPVLFSFVAACVLGGALVGRFGGRAGAAEAGVGGVGAALLACVVAWLGSSVTLAGSMLTFVVLGSIGALFGWLGGRLGHTFRP